MVNVTITVPDSLKKEMDELSEVVWSPICRDAISRYIFERNNPSPMIEISSNEIYLRDGSNDHEIGYPTIRIPLRIHNKMSIGATIDRVIFRIKFWKNSRAFPVGEGHDLYKLWISGNSTHSKNIFLVLLREKLEELKNTFDSTFTCEIKFTIFVDNFKQPYTGTVHTRIPIDDWNKTINKSLGEMQ